MSCYTNPAHYTVKLADGSQTTVKHRLHVWDQDKFCNCYTDDEGTGWGSCQDCADVMLTAYHKMTPTFPETCANNANGFEGRFCIISTINI